MDVLTDVLKTLRLSTSTYFCSVFSGTWGMDIQGGSTGVFHAVIEGQCWITIKQNEEAIHLKQGDIVAFPTGDAHRIGHKNSHQWMPGQDVVSKVKAGNNPFNSDAGDDITLLCGSFEYDTSIEHPFLKDLPCFIHLNPRELGDNDLGSFIATLASESYQSKPGSQVVIDNLTEVLFVQLMRAYMKQPGKTMSYMSALIHPQIGEALSQIHNDKTASLTVENLAERVAMSRTTFTDKFTHIIGTSPKRYMINWRMQKARRRLQTSRDSMISIAEMAGYNSEAAFSKAYKQFFGDTPGANRMA